jgi:hypothetical protein
MAAVVLGLMINRRMAIWGCVVAGNNEKAPEILPK